MDQTFSLTWGLSFDDLTFINGYNTRTRLGISLQLKHLRRFGYFADEDIQVGEEILNYLSDQLGGNRPVTFDYDFQSRSARRHMMEIVQYLGFERMSDKHRTLLAHWLQCEHCGHVNAVEELISIAYQWCLEKKVFAPSRKIVERVVRSARREFQKEFLQNIVSQLSQEAIVKMETSLVEPDASTGFSRLKDDIGGATLDNILAATERLQFVEGLHLPEYVLKEVERSFIDQLVRRVSAETVSQMRRHSVERRLGLFTLYLIVRKSQMIDRVIDLLVEQIHRINAKSKRKVIKDISREIEKVHGKERLLAEIAVASMEHPEGRICDVIYPVAGQQKLSAIVKEYRSKGTLDRQIQFVMRGSYASHYRRMLPLLLSVLEFRSNNAAWRPVLEGLICITKLQKAGKRFASEDDVPVEAIPTKWRGSVIDDKGRLNVISFELCLLTQLRERIRAKEIWVVGADRYRNPDEDLPKDFAERRDTYYAGLKLTRDAEAFVSEVRKTLEDELRQLNASLPHNDKVRLRWTGKNRISVSPFEPAPEPKGLVCLKAEITRQWPMTGLLDTLKEAALGTGYLDRFETSASREVLAPNVRDQRLLLCLYGLGTNAGLKRIAGGLADISYEELLRVRRNYIHPAALRAACARVADATLAIRNPVIWGEAGTACAADSTKFGAWDRNLMSEWHARYGGRGVMIYWHVERQATCIYSQLKRCSSSEVAAMIEGVLRHCTDMEIQGVVA